jgi:hypothetical protein
MRCQSLLPNTAGPLLLLEACPSAAALSFFQQQAACILLQAGTGLVWLDHSQYTDNALFMVSAASDLSLCCSRYKITSIWCCLPLSAIATRNFDREDRFGSARGSVPDLEWSRPRADAYALLFSGLISTHSDQAVIKYGPSGSKNGVF